MNYDLSILFQNVLGLAPDIQRVMLIVLQEKLGEKTVQTRKPLLSTKQIMAEMNDAESVHSTVVALIGASSSKRGRPLSPLAAEVRKIVASNKKITLHEVRVHLVNVGMGLNIDNSLYNIYYKARKLAAL